MSGHQLKLAYMHIAYGGDLNDGESKLSEEIGGFNIKKVRNLKIKGAASLVDRSIVYTCNLQNYINHCS